MGNSKRVLHLITGLERGGGAENMLLNLVPRLKGKHSICVMKGKGEVAIELEKKGIKIYYLDIRSPLNFKYIFKYRKILKDFRPDVQISYLIHADIFGRIFGKLFRVRNIVSYIRNRHDEKKYFYLDHATLSLADFILLNSKPLVHFYVKKHKVNKNKISFIPNAVDINKIINLSSVDTDFDFNSNNKYIISTARFHVQKDLPTLIKAFYIVTQKKIDIDLILANDGNQKNKIKKLVQDLGLDSRVHFIGKKSNIYPYLLNSDIFVLTSKFEGMSNALLEAMALKIITLTTGIPENLQINDSKYCFPIGDHQALADKIIEYVDLDKKEILEENYSKIKNNYSIDRVSEIFNNFLNKYDRAC